MSTCEWNGVLPRCSISPFSSTLPTSSGYFRRYSHPEAWGFFSSSVLFKEVSSSQTFSFCSHSCFLKCALACLFHSCKSRVKVVGPKNFLRGYLGLAFVEIGTSFPGGLFTYDHLEWGLSLELGQFHSPISKSWQVGNQKIQEAFSELYFSFFGFRYTLAHIFLCHFLFFIIAISKRVFFFLPVSLYLLNTSH